MTPPDPRTAEERLRAAAKAVLLELDVIRKHREETGASSLLIVHPMTHADLRAALAVEPVPAPLDVERLAVAMRYVERTMQYAMGVNAPDDGPPDQWYDGYAREVNKRYAALAAPPEPEEP